MIDASRLMDALRLPEGRISHASLFAIIGYVVAFGLAAACFINVGLTFLFWGNDSGLAWLGVWHRPALVGRLFLCAGLTSYGLAIWIAWVWNQGG